MPTTDSDLDLDILLVDDDPDIRETLGDHLLDRGYRVHLARAGDEAMALLRNAPIDIVITDLRMPGMDGFELLRRVRIEWPAIEVVVLTAYGDIDSAVQALRNGAFDYFTKPFDLYDITASLERTARFCALRQENERFKERLDRFGAEGRQHYGLDAIIGESPAIRRVKDLVRQVSEATRTSVLIQGETGTGKELVARAIHYESARRDGPFVAVDCSAIPANLVESEFYGHVKGAFTDAREERKGRFEMADGGTLFMDEISDMETAMQRRLLRTLEERRVQPLGGDGEIPVDVRVVSAANQDLARAVAEGTFREDLYYRFNAFVIRIPPLRERREDIVLLATHFLERYARELHKPVARFTLQAQVMLEAHPFPGNIRELRNIVERAVILCRGEEVGAAELEFAPTPQEPAPADPGAEAETAAVEAEAVAEDGLSLPAMEERMIRRALRLCGGNKAQAARLLCITRDSLRRRLERYGIE